MQHAEPLARMEPSRSVVVLSRDDVRALLSMKALIPLMSRAFEIISSGQAVLPLRWIVDLPQGNALGTMPGFIHDPACFGVKVTAVFPGNFGSPYQSHQGIIVLFETVHGCPRAIIHGGEVTAARTAAASAAATDVLALPGADALGILGYGEQAERHLEAMLSVRPIKHVRVWGRSIDRARAFAADAMTQYPVEIEPVFTAREAVEGMPIVCTVTGSAEPVVFGEWISAGTHLNVVGSSSAAARELDVAAVEKCRIYADSRASALAQGGEILAAQASGHVGQDAVFAEIGEVLLGQRAGRQNKEDITMFKSLGISVEDLLTSLYLFGKAETAGVGTRMVF